VNIHFPHLSLGAVKASPEQITRFIRDQSGLLTERVNLILLLGWTLVPLFGVADFFLYPNHFGRFITYRIVAGICCACLYIFNIRGKTGAQSLNAGLTAAYVVAISIILMIVEGNGFSTPYYAGLNLVLLGMCAVLPVPVQKLAIHGLIIYGIYLFSVILFSRIGNVGAFIANNMFMLSTLMIALISNHVSYLSRLREYLMRQELEAIQEQLRRRSADLENLFSESENLYQILVDNADDCIFVLQDGVMKFPNPRTIDLFGYSEKELTSTGFINFVVEEDRAVVWGRRKPTDGRKQTVTTSTFRINRPPHEIVWVDMSAVAIDWLDRPAYFVFLRDVTERKNMEVELLHAQKMEAIGTLAGGIAHDFNNLLTGIIGHTSLMRLETGPDEHPPERLRAIEHLVRSGADLTRQLLGFARGGKYEVKPSDLNNIIEKTSEMFGRTRREIIIHHNLTSDLRVVNADSGQIEQVLINLFVNAAQAMPSGGNLFIETNNVAIDEASGKHFSIEPGDFVKIVVTDTGIGMDEATQRRVFEPFFTTKEIGLGTGLGLASAYGIIKNHGGSISVHSKPGKGASFTIYLPATTAKLEEDETTSDQIMTGSGTILIIDDQDVILDVGQEMLKTIGYKALAARGGEEALEIYKEKMNDIDLVILDMIMPSMSGEETYNNLKALNQKVKVILSSGYSINDQASRILDQGCNGFIQKPFDAHDLSKKVREVLDRK
jgi:two-component system, cell cycle sensor histidine kinase and response regulator CckA